MLSSPGSLPRILRRVQKRYLRDRCISRSRRSELGQDRNRKYSNLAFLRRLQWFSNFEAARVLGFLFHSFYDD